ncbi:MAG: MFS transporter [Actinomycetota bacterium]
MNRIVALAALSGVVSHALARSTFPILLPAIESELLTSNSQAGLLTTANFAAYLVGVAIVTTISGRVEPQRLLYSGMAIAGTGFALLAVAPGPWLLGAGQALAGLGSAGIWMSAPVIATAAVPATRRGMTMGIISSTMGLGIIVASQGTNLIRVIQDDEDAWRPTWIAAAVFAVLLLATMAALMRTPPTASLSGGISLERLRTVPRWVPLAAGYWLFGLIVSSFTPFFGLALDDAGFSRAHVGNLYALFGVAAVLGAVTLGRLSDRVGRRPVLVGALTAISVASLLVITEREPFAAAAALLFGAASFTYPVLTVAYVSDHLQDRAFANALGALTLVYGSALIVGPVIGGVIGDSSLGFPALFVAIAMTSATGALVATRLAPASSSPLALSEEPSKSVSG